MASAAEKKADFAGALAKYRAAAQTYPEESEAWAALGEHLRFYGHDLEAASAAFRKALSAEHQDPRAAAYAWRGLGEIEAKSEHDEQAITAFEKSVKALPLADTHRSLCHLYCRRREFDKAAEHAGAAVALDPEDAIARLLYAAQLFRAGKADEGRREFERALSANGVNADGEHTAPVHCCILYNAAGYLSVTGQREHALKMLNAFFKTPNHRHLERKEVEQDADFENLKNDMAFRRLLDHAYASQSTPSEPVK